MAVNFGETDSAVEPELRGQMPRRVRYTFRAQATRLFVLCLLLGGVGLITSLSVQDTGELTRLAASGIRTTGRITGKHTSGHKNTTYYLDYSYTANGRAESGEETVSSSDFRQANAGDSVLVTYLPDDPTVHRVGVVDEARVTHARTLWALGTLGAALVLGLLLVATEANFRNHRALLETGVAVMGRLTNRYVTRGNKSNSYYIQYEFDGPAGPVSGKASVGRSLYDQTSPGTPTTILYDPAKPSNSRPYYIMTGVRRA